MPHWFDELARRASRQPTSRGELFGRPTPEERRHASETVHLDDVARALTHPIGRRRALGVIAAGVAGTTFAGGVRPAAAQAQCGGRPCQTFNEEQRRRCREACAEKGEGEYCRVNFYGSCACCAPGRVCCGEDTYGSTACCEAGQTCSPDRENTTCWGCSTSSGRETCGKGCCDPGQVCHDPAKDRLGCREECAPGRVLCGGDCCQADERCASGNEAPGGNEYCVPRCPTGEDAEGERITCLVWDPASKTCKDRCPPGFVCDARGIAGGGCRPRCIGGCRVYDHATGRCKDTCDKDEFCDWRGLTGEPEDGQGVCRPKCSLDCQRYDAQFDVCVDTCPVPGTCRASARGSVCECAQNEQVCGNSCCPPIEFFHDDPHRPPKVWRCDPYFGCTTLPATEVAPSARKVTATGGVVRLKVTCGGPGTCRGRVTVATLPSRAATRRGAKAIVLGRRSYRVAAGGSVTVKVKMSSRRRKLLRKKGRLPVRASLTDAAGLVVDGSRAFVVKSPRGD